MHNHLVILGRQQSFLQNAGDVTHYAAGLVQIDIVLSMTSNVAIISIATAVLGEYVEEIVLSSAGYEPGK